jgi:predicted membrane protein
MKMHGLLFGSLFWGILISLIGFSIILKYVLNIDLPLVRIFFGIILIIVGVRIIVGHSGKPQGGHNKHVNYYNSSRDYSIVFSNGTVDLTGFTDGQKIPYEVNVVFGHATVLVPDSMNLEVNSTTVFGSTIFPERAYNGFGEDTFKLNNNPDAPLLKIETNAVFGRLVFEIVPTKTSKTSVSKPDSIVTEEKTSF